MAEIKLKIDVRATLLGLNAGEKIAIKDYGQRGLFSVVASQLKNQGLGEYALSRDGKGFYVQRLV